MATEKSFLIVFYDMPLSITPFALHLYSKSKRVKYFMHNCIAFLIVLAYIPSPFCFFSSRHTVGIRKNFLWPHSGVEFVFIYLFFSRQVCMPEERIVIVAQLEMLETGSS